jgi:putative transposase
MLAQGDRMLADGMCLGDVCDALEISLTTYRRWRREFGGLTSAQAERVKDLEQEITTLRRLLRDAEREQTALLLLAVAHRSSAGRAPMTAPGSSGTERTAQVDYPAAASSVAAASAEQLGQAIAEVLDDHDPLQDYGPLPHDARSLEAGRTRDGILWRRALPSAPG